MCEYPTRSAPRTAPGPRCARPTASAPLPHRRARAAGILVLPVAAVLVAAIALTPAGATVTRIINRALAPVHVSRAVALSLPTAGKLLLSNALGTWVVSTHGSVRRLGPWTQADWSPRGKYLAVASADALAAIDPTGKLAWRLPERAVSDPTWYWPSGYRIAYRSGAEPARGHRFRARRPPPGHARGADRAGVAPRARLSACLRHARRRGRGPGRRHGRRRHGAAVRIPGDPSR